MIRIPIITIYFLLFFIFFTGYQATAIIKSNYTEEDVLVKARVYFTNFMNDPYSGPTFFGLKDSVEVQSAELKYPFQLVSLTENFVLDERFDPSSQYWDFLEWWVPVFVGNEMRSFIFVGEKGDSLYKIGGGAKGFARDLNRSIKDSYIKLENSRFLVMFDVIEHMDCWLGMSFIAGNNDYVIFPIIIDELNLKCCRNVLTIIILIL